FAEVALGQLVAADAVEASVALDSLLGGELRADEIRVAAPRIAIAIDRSGDSDLGRLARRLVARAPGAGPGPSRLRRILVTSGALSARIAGLGELAAEGVAIVPDAGGVRITTGAVHVTGSAGPLAIALGFARSAAELSLPQLRLGRVLAVDGVGTVDGSAGTAGPAARAPAAPPSPPPAPPLARLADIAVGRLAPDGPLELHASVDDDGIPRALAIAVQPRDLAIAIRGERVPLQALAAAVPHGLAVDTAHASGAVIVRRGPGRVAIDVDGAVEGARIDHRAIAELPVPLAAEIHASVAISGDAIAVPRAALAIGAARWTATGWLRRAAPLSGQIDASLAPAPCRDLLASLPAELRGPLDGMVVDGSFGGHLRIAVDLAAPAGDGVRLAASASETCRVLGEPPEADVGRLAAPGDPGPSDGSRARPAGDARGFTPLARLPRHVVRAFVSAEDARFYDHAGFDLDQIARSLEIDLREHRLARGGSTISQQLVKNAFLSQRRSFDRKLQEAILTWRAEARLDKRQILERYLNLIELGPRVHGVAAAAQYWFGIAPRELSVRQAAFLAALTSEPSSMTRRIRRAGGLDPESLARVEQVLRAMHRDGAIDGDELDAARSERLAFARGAGARGAE
ncbi:MAG TPA: biosynthetic peptidoglycan transglycosylase, partial [Kofleriaceae bacterium]|nr:biosynthetic peptidoglycan transglycosylase [Kofleriaceae bacterium]